MTSNDTPATGRGPQFGHRRTLGRGPGAAPPAPQPVDAEADTEETAGTEREAAVGTERAAEPSSAVRTPVAVRTSAPAPAEWDDVPGPDADPAPETALAGPGAGDSPAGPGTASVVDSGAGAAGTAEGEDDGRFKVRLSNFEGPFDLLLQLISKHRLDVTEVALSKVTDEFMAYIRALGPDWDLDETTEFLVVAATLLDLKAARLLPAAEVEDEADLALLEARDLLFARLLQYRAYKRIAEILSRRLDEEARRYPRTVGLEPQYAELLPEVVISIGAEGFAKLAVKAMQPRPKPQVYVDHIHAPLVSVQEQAGIVVARLKELGEASFRTLTQDTDDTLTVVARFLALLELYREKAVALDQETALGELTVRWTGGDEDTAPVVTDEFDRPPEPPDEPQKEKGASRT
ncbi:segregation and condensation protein A [Streptomyces sp. KMM 9044]|uniref:segregation and condensation protein A n=1 Tax=Streptomyces sp. KMM 9044 TaxID=2744474 RepID=UPI002150A1CB|nr:segregation/condensation protein A [Streptomyces sp. KMM 9044]WAX80788.1 segregation/condensation protein A [Streptomyces sp. KMM 9044]